MTNISSDYTVPDTSRFLFETCYSSEDMKAKKFLTLLVQPYKAIVKVEPSADILEGLRNMMNELIEKIDHIKESQDTVLRDVLRRGDEQTSLETAQTRKGEGSF